MTDKMRQDVKRRLSGEKPTVWIGKNGVSQKLVEEIEKQLAKRDGVKVKILGSALEGKKSEQIASITAEQTGASLVEVRGHTFILYKNHGK